MMNKALATVGITAAAIGMTAAPAMAIGDSDGFAASAQGNGGNNATGTHGNQSPNFHTLDNPNICLPEIKDIQAVQAVAVQVPVGILNQTTKQICNQGHTTQATGDAPLSHLIG
ncbi:rodlet layer protein [Streptomyces sp. RB6PN25]|uniref:Rodlet layer protein n=1 Tax=Streptomyces humicola TaxID=2953240 RepID=A0ABT1PYV7_9ACTN|nr:rodlet layer protein [Streptomyces humicola]MCQ4082842.1 rodlet layer protein [Streptomyces humicola]